MFACTWIGWQPPIVKAAPFQLFEDRFTAKAPRSLRDAEGKSDWGRRGQREIRKGNRFFMWLEHLAPGRPWSVPLHVLNSE
jgi:hypothetical protein